MGVPSSKGDSPEADRIEIQRQDDESHVFDIPQDGYRWECIVDSKAIP